MLIYFHCRGNTHILENFPWFLMVQVYSFRGSVDAGLVPSVPSSLLVRGIILPGIHILIPWNSLSQCLNGFSVETILPPLELVVGGQVQGAVDE